MGIYVYCHTGISLSLWACTCSTHCVESGQLTEVLEAVLCYTPGIYADGYIVFIFPFVC